MRIAVGSDHAGFEEPQPYYKPAIVEHVKVLGHEVVDCGADGPASVDYPSPAPPTQACWCAARASASASPRTVTPTFAPPPARRRKGRAFREAITTPTCFAWGAAFPRWRKASASSTFGLPRPLAKASATNVALQRWDKSEDSPRRHRGHGESTEKKEKRKAIFLYVLSVFPLCFPRVLCVSVVSLSQKETSPCPC